jgi:preprotein translocase subunit YajC
MYKIFWSENLKGRDNLEDPGKDRRITMMVVVVMMMMMMMMMMMRRRRRRSRSRR